MINMPDRPSSTIRAFAISNSSCAKVSKKKFLEKTGPEIVALYSHNLARRFCVVLWRAAIVEAISEESTASNLPLTSGSEQMPCWPQPCGVYPRVS